MQVSQLTSEHLEHFQLARSVSSLKYHALIKQYGSAKQALKSLEKLQDIGAELQDLNTNDCKLLFYIDQNYPSAFKQLVDAPPVLIYKGKIDLLQRKCISIVGSRQATLASMQFAKKIAHELGLAGQIVVSGLAAGIDTQAHQGSLFTGTISILGCGLNVIYPSENTQLFHDIAEKGLLLSEFPFNYPVKRDSFPKRNRLITALSWGCIIVEADIKSGSMITAQYALEQGKELFAVPGHPMDPHSKGCNALIKNGAALIEDLNDVLSRYDSMPEVSYSNIIHEKSMTEQSLKDKIMKLLNTGTGTNIDAIYRHIQCNIDTLRSTLVELELNNKIYLDDSDNVYIYLDK